MAEKVMMIALTPTMDDGKIVKWNKKVGDKIVQGDVICEVETDKSSMDYESLNNGTLLHIVIEEGQSAKIGQTIAVFGKTGEDISLLLQNAKTEVHVKESKDEQKTGAKAKIKIDTQTNTGVIGNMDLSTRIKISPLAKKTALKKGMVLNNIAGSGPDGRILVKDVENFDQSAVFGDGMADIVIPVEGIRAVIAQRLSESKFNAPHFYLKSSIRMQQLVALRNTLNTQLQKQKKSKVSMNAFFIKLAAEAIKRNPVINSSWQESEIIQYKSIDIGLAVDLGKGLLTPIVRNCGNKGIIQIDAELQTLIEKIRNGTISSEEYTGATFTISNLGSFGVDEFTAIINPPGSAILAIGRSKQVPVVNDEGKIEVASVMNVTISCDHRVIDGIIAARFLTFMKSVFENSALALF